LFAVPFAPVDNNFSKETTDNEVNQAWSIVNTKAKAFKFGEFSPEKDSKAVPLLVDKYS
jgi:hypothetical protein